MARYGEPQHEQPVSEPDALYGPPQHDNSVEDPEWLISIACKAFDAGSKPAVEAVETEKKPDTETTRREPAVLRG